MFHCLFNCPRYFKNHISLYFKLHHIDSPPHDWVISRHSLKLNVFFHWYNVIDATSNCQYNNVSFRITGSVIDSSNKR